MAVNNPYIWGTGRRKTSVARVRVRPSQGGEGKITVRGVTPKDKTVEVYFGVEFLSNQTVCPASAFSASVS